MRGAPVLIALLLGMALDLQAQAQAPAETPSQWLIGMSLGVPGAGREAVPELFTLGINFTQVRPGQLSGDISIGTMPMLFEHGVVPVGLRGDLTVPFATEHFIVLPEAGVSGIGTFVPGGGGGGVVGFNAGVTTAVRWNGMGLRTGVTVHKFFALDEPVWLLEVGFFSGCGGAAAR